MKIVDIRPTTVTVPLEAPLRHANGCHWGRFVRTIVEVETDNGIVGLGEMGGGGESAEAVFRSLKGYLAGHDPAHIEEMRFRVANPTASLYNNRTQALAALEFACLDILGQACPSNKTRSADAGLRAETAAGAVHQFVPRRALKAARAVDLPSSDIQDRSNGDRDAAPRAHSP